MPELSWDFGYPFFFIIAACSVGIVVLFFRQLERYIGYRSLS